jgi:glycosyltransferase involved in cell wall biosynthesis
VIKVSVVVPVYNPWPFIEACVDSLVTQSMPTEEFEVVFVDDGSTDETPAYLDDVAARYSHISVIHQENSGWPGKPRNVGVAAASGEYVFFCDNDDWLGPEALDRLYDYAKENDSDVVLGKMAGIGRGVPQNIFRRNRPRATLADAPLMDSLTPHKLFRRAFLDAHQIRFPEGKRRLEDHLFVVTAYLLASTISVYADYTCYYHIRRSDSSNAGFSAIDWPGYFANLSEALDVVVAHTEPGDLRDSIYRRWLQNEMVNRLSGRRLTSLEPDEAERLFDAAHRTAARYFGEGVVRRLPVVSRGVARALIAGDLETVRRLAEVESQWDLDTHLLQVGWSDGRLQLSGVADFRDRSRPTGGELGQSELLAGLGDDEYRSGLSRSTLLLDLTERRSGERWSFPATVERRGAVMVFVADVDPERQAAGGPLQEGIWDLYVECSLLGLRRRKRLALEPERLPSGPLLQPDAGPDRPVAAYLTKKNFGLSLDVGLVFHPKLRPTPEPEAGTQEPVPEPQPASGLGEAAREQATRLRRLAGRAGRRAVERVNRPER